MTASPAALRALLERLEKAECGDRGIDADIWRAFNPDGLLGPDDGLPAYSYSIDAAVMLCATSFPKGRWCVMQWGKRGRKDVYAADLIGPTEECDDGPTPALALCRAIVRAKLAESPD